MARRLAPKIATGVEAHSHLITMEQLPEVCTAENLFGQRRPLEVEVGSGKGLFLGQAAQAQPWHFFLGIEIVGKYATLVAARLARQRLDNAKVMHADAQQVFAGRFPPNSLSAIHIYFPDPWWKKRHRRRRIMNPDFLQRVESCLIAGGRLHFWTDVQTYFEETLQLIRQHVALEGPFAVDEQPALHDFDYRTHFERRVRRNELPVFRAEFRKPGWIVEAVTDVPGHSAS